MRLILSKNRIYLIVFLCCFCFLTMNGQGTYIFEEELTEEKFVEVSPGIYQYELFTLRVLNADGTNALSDEGAQISVTGPLALPGSIVSLSGVIAGSLYLTAGEIYSHGNLMASANLWEEDTDESRALLYLNEGTTTIDSVVYKTTENDDFITIGTISVDMLITSYSVGQLRYDPQGLPEPINNGGYVGVVNDWQDEDESDVDTLRVAVSNSRSSSIIISFLDGLLGISPIDFSDVNWSVRIKADPMGQNPERYGFFEEEGASESAIKVFGYTPPKELTSGTNLNQKIQIYEVGSNVVLFEHDLLFYQTPVVLVHGLWGTGNFEVDGEEVNGSLGAMGQRLSEQHPFEEQFIYIADYHRTAGASFNTNRSVVPDAIEALKNRLLAERVVVDKVDIVGHSMGGLLARQYIQSPAYREDVRKLITVNTPHSGSQLADLVSDVRQNQPDLYVDACEEWFAKVFGLRCEDPAVADLEINSGDIAVLNSPALMNDKVWLHSLGSIYDGGLIVPIGSFLFGFDIDRVFNGQPYDLVVEVNSQTGGVSQAAQTIYPISKGNHQHSAIKEDPEVIDSIAMLLLADPTNGAFVKRYNPIPVEYNSPVRDVRPRRFEMRDGGVGFQGFQKGQILELGEEQITVTATPTVPMQQFAISWATDGNLFSDKGLVISENGEPVTTTFDLKDNYRLGTRYVNFNGISAEKTDIPTAYKYREKVYVTTYEAPDSISIGSLGNDTVKLTTAGTIVPQIRATFSGKTYMIATTPNITYHFENGIVQNMGDGALFGTRAGTDMMWVEFNGVQSDRVPVDIIEQEPRDRSVGTRDVTVSNLQSYPSPTTGTVTVDLDAGLSASSQINAAVFDLNGRSVFSGTLPVVDDRVQFDLSDTAPGMYQIRITGEKNQYISRVVKQ